LDSSSPGPGSWPCPLIWFGITYSTGRYARSVGERREILRCVMLETGSTQSELSRLSGVHQPSISQYLSGRVEMSDDQLDRLLSCMGHRLEVVRRPVVVELTRSERRSWQLHLRISSHLSQHALEDWRPILEQNLKRLRGSVQGQPHERNLKRWRMLVESGDLSGIHRFLTGLDRDSIEMREVSPFGGLLSPQERSDVLRQAG
jgi:transcriptional regulator with XRE-family HTH domain